MIVQLNGPKMPPAQSLQWPLDGFQPRHSLIHLQSRKVFGRKVANCITPRTNSLCGAEKKSTKVQIDALTPRRNACLTFATIANCSIRNQKENKVQLSALQLVVKWWLPRHSHAFMVPMWTSSVHRNRKFHRFIHRSDVVLNLSDSNPADAQFDSYRASAMAKVGTDGMLACPTRARISFWRCFMLRGSFQLLNIFGNLRKILRSSFYLFIQYLVCSFLSNSSVPGSLGLGVVSQWPQKKNVSNL